jgi:hypothetical protein
MKLCKKCNIEKPLNDFCNRKGEIDGKHRYCKICLKKENDVWYQDSKEQRKDYYKQYRDQNKEYFNKYCTNHYHTNKDLYREWNRNQYDTNIEYKIKHIVSARLHEALKTYNELKKNRTIEYLGCSIGEYVIYLESKFTSEMNWENQGTYWEIDHIKPIDKFDLTNPDELNECFHYLNTQPLHWKENREKSNKF